MGAAVILTGSGVEAEVGTGELDGSVGELPLLGAEEGQI
jgi:hypothetical protein